MVFWRMNVILIIFGLLILSDIVMSGLYEKRLLKYLFDSSRSDAHNPIERPSANDTETLNVSVKFFLNQVMDVDEKNQVLTTIIWMDLIWNDYHFLWNPKEFGNITTLNLPYTAIWRPDILLYNCADEKFDRTFPTNTIIRNDGTVQWMPPGLFKSTCNIDILWFPFDEQSCILKFGSWTYYGDQINFQLQCINSSQPDCTQVGPVDLSEYSRNGEFHLSGVTILLSLTMFLQLVADKLPQTSEAIPLIGIYFSCTMFMCSLSIVFTVLVLNYHHRSADCNTVPSWIRNIVNTYLAKLLFMEPPKRSQIIEVEDISSSISDHSIDHYTDTRSSKGEIHLNINEINEQLNNNNKTLIDWKLNTTTHNNNTTNNNHVSMPKQLTSKSQLCNQNRQTISLCNNHQLNTSLKQSSKCLMANVIDLDDEFRVTTLYENNSLNQFQSNNLYDKQSKLPISSSLTNQLQSLSPQQPSQQQPPPPPYRLYNSETVQDPFNNELHVNSKNNSSQNIHLNQSNQNELITDPLNIYKLDLELIITELHFITKRLRDNEYESLVSLEWKFAARVIDRFCLVIFSVCNIVVTFAILCSAPNLIASFMP
ncbi:Neuronal acetylcholine receptor subunit alpha-7 isoform 1 [Schistosoma japonicum]|uniref:Neuronal acetylcholine receptor subunit alpha-7 isoform 1 n=1 Tax=Schistosoma japonicum TaxID=6182 RepID=A0A4Z2CXK2_SCHJA|nr:Neuronal acetylcholine receptor subunit alpha-7 isoform 1 [Schistosoma japonicum]